MRQEAIDKTEVEEEKRLKSIGGGAGNNKRKEDRTKRRS